MTLKILSSPGEPQTLAPALQPPSIPAQSSPTNPQAGHLEVRVIGSGPAAPQVDTGSSGLLITLGDDRLLIDCGPGTISRLRRTMDPRTLSAVLVTHFHADHYLDLVALRYLFPWPGVSGDRLPVHLPPGGNERLRALAGLINERPTFFSDAFDIREYEPSVDLAIGGLHVEFHEAQHYVPAWSVRLTTPAGAVVAYTGDSGPCDALQLVAHDADLLVIEATLTTPADDDVRRGHLTIEEALDVGFHARARRLLVTHYPSDQRPMIAKAVRGAKPPAVIARPGLRLTVRPAGATSRVRKG